VVGGYVVANAVKPLLALVSAWWQILGIRFFDRFAKGVRGTARDVMVADSVDKSNIGSAYGLIQAMDSAGAIAGPLLALALIGHYGMRGVFAAAAIPGALCILVAWLGVREVAHAGAHATAAVADDKHTDAPGKQNASPLLPVGRTPPYSQKTRINGAPLHFPFGYYYVLAVVALFSLANSSDMFLVLRAGNVGIPAAQSPLLGLVFNVTFTLVSWPAGKFSDRFSRSTIAAGGYAVFAVVYFMFALAPSRRAIWLTMAFYGLFYSLTNPVLKALVVETVGSEVRGRALGIYFFVTSVTTLLASVITGALWKVYGAAVPFYFSAAIAAVSAIALLAHRSPRAEGT
jgi:MFS family permease